VADRDRIDDQVTSRPSSISEFTVGLGVAPRKHGQMHVLPENEAQLAVELDRGMVGIEYVQERGFRARRDGSRKRTHKLRRQPLSSAGGVDAHGADFSEAIEAHALPCHGDQHSIATNADVLPEFNRARTERPRMRGLHKRQHVGNMRHFQPDNIHRAGLSGHPIQDHLIDGISLDDGKG